jgi:broad specificity phosphatase PhoE
VGPRPTLIYLFRHGEVLLAETGRFIGHLDVSLSPRGERQCEAQARQLREVELAAVFSSDLLRARRSSEIIAAPHELRPVHVPALREMAMGEWEGLTAGEIRARDAAGFSAWMARVGEYPFPGGESVPDLVARAWPALEAIVAAHPGEAVAVIAHGGTNRAILCRALGLPLGRLLTLGQDYGGLSLLEHAGGRWTLRRLNEAPVL